MVEVAVVEGVEVAAAAFDDVVLSVVAEVVDAADKSVDVAAAGALSGVLVAGWAVVTAVVVAVASVEVATVEVAATCAKARIGKRTAIAPMRMRDSIFIFLIIFLLTINII